MAEGSSFKLSDRTTKLVEIFVGHQTVQVFHSKITLEYDLAEAGDKNAAHMAAVWEKCFHGVPGTFNSTRVIESGVDGHAKAMAAWRGICRAGHTGSKAEFAHRLAAQIVEKDKDDEWVVAFDIPVYLENGNHICRTVLQTVRFGSRSHKRMREPTPQQKAVLERTDAGVQSSALRQVVERHG